MSIETKQCSICLDAPPYRDCLTLYGDKCAYVVSLQAALREALNMWEGLNTEYDGTTFVEHQAERIAELRKFLDDK